MNLLKDSNTNLCKFLASKEIWLVAAVCTAIVLGTYNSVFSYLALLLSALGILFLSDENSLCLLLFIMPFATIFKSAPGMQSFFTYLIIFYVLFSIIKKHAINTKWLLSMLALIVFLFIQMKISVNILRSIKFIVNLFLIYFATNLKANDNKKVMLYYIFGILVSSSLALLNLFPNLSSYVVEKNLGGDSYQAITRFAGLYADPNYYAVNLIIALCLIVILVHNKKLSPIPAIILTIAFIGFVFLTYSKSAFLMIALPAFIFLYSIMKKRKYFILSIAFLAIGIFLIYALTGKFETLNIILSRFQTGDDLSSLTTGRWDIWISYVDYLQNSYTTLLFGSGFGANLIGEHAPHNTYLDMLYYLGIVGTALLIITFFHVVKTRKVQFKRNILNYSIWLCVLIMYFFLSELFYFDWAFHIIIAILVFRTDCNRIQNG